MFRLSTEKLLKRFKFRKLQKLLKKVLDKKPLLW